MLGGCATTDDPHDGGFISGVKGLSTGTYERRVQERESNLATVRAMQPELEREGATLTTEKSDRERLLAQEKRKLATLDGEVRSLERRLAEMKDAKGAGDARVGDLQKRVDDLQGRLAKQTRSIDALEGGGSGSADALEGGGSGGELTDSRRRQLETQRAALQREYEELLNLTLTLAQ